MWWKLGLFLAGLLGLSAWFFIFEYRPEETPPPIQLNQAPKKETTLETSEEFAKLVGVETLKGKPLKEFFAGMNQRGNDVCRYLHGRSYDSAALKRFSPGLSKYPPMLIKLIAGCHNFFKMNDVYLVEMLNKINEIYGNEEKDCYSVGFSQIYFLSTRVHCTEITAIDIDWRILWAHYQMVEKVPFKDMRVGWSADYAYHINEQEKVSPATFCYATDLVNCRKAFKDMRIDSIGLQLSFLHQIRIKPTNKITLVYLSNAIDPGYTSKKQFDEMLVNLKKNMSYAQKVVLVYHGGGSRQFGIYEVKLLHEDALQITTVCSDDYVWSSSYSTRGQKYKTYIDKFVVNEGPACSDR